MKDEKKTKVVTFRTDEETRKILEEIAKTNKWSVSQVVEQLVKNFIVDPHPEEITISTEQLGKVYEELKNKNLPIVRLETDTTTEEIDGKIEPYRRLLIHGKKSIYANKRTDLEPIREVYEIATHYETTTPITIN